MRGMVWSLQIQPMERTPFNVAASAGLAPSVASGRDCRKTNALQAAARLTEIRMVMAVVSLWVP